MTKTASTTTGTPIPIPIRTGFGNFTNSLYNPSNRAFTLFILASFPFWLLVRKPHSPQGSGMPCHESREPRPAALVLMQLSDLCPW